MGFPRCRRPLPPGSPRAPPRVGSSELPIVVAFRTVATSFLNEHDETIALAVLDGDESFYIAIEETSQPVRYVTHVGSRTPAFASASGRVVLATQPPHSGLESHLCRAAR